MLSTLAPQPQCWRHLTRGGVSQLTHLGWTDEEWVFSQVLIDEPGVSSNHASLLFPWQYSPEPFYKEGWVPTLPSFSLGSFWTSTRSTKFQKIQTCLSWKTLFSIESRHCCELFSVALGVRFNHVSVLSQACRSSHWDHQERNSWRWLGGQIYSQKVSLPLCLNF